MKGNQYKLLEAGGECITGEESRKPKRECIKSNKTFSHVTEEDRKKMKKNSRKKVQFRVDG